MFGIGVTEILIMLIVLGLWIGVPLVIVLLVLRSVRKQGSSSELLEENERLRREIADLEKTIRDVKSQ
jgi:hypothetical protein